MSYVTIQENVVVDGYAFKANTQYTYTTDSMIQVDCGCDTGEMIYKKHYKVTIDDTDYWISSEYAFLSNIAIPLEDQNFEEKMIERGKGPVDDYVAAAKEVMGIDITESYEPQFRDKRPYKEERSANPGNRT